MRNHMTTQFAALSVNESFARAVIGAFVSQLDPTIGVLTDIKTAVSEAVTNAVIHGYGGRGGEVTLAAELTDDVVVIKVSDDGVGIEDVEKAREPFYTTWGGDERSGMGFTVMETFMDSVEVTSSPGKGTCVTMTKSLDGENQGA